MKRVDCEVSGAEAYRSAGAYEPQRAATAISCACPDPKSTGLFVACFELLGQAITAILNAAIFRIIHSPVLGLR